MTAFSRGHVEKKNNQNNPNIQSQRNFLDDPTLFPYILPLKMRDAITLGCRQMVEW